MNLAAHITIAKTRDASHFSGDRRFGGDIHGRSCRDLARGVFDQAIEDARNTNDGDASANWEGRAIAGVAIDIKAIGTIGNKDAILRGANATVVAGNKALEGIRSIGSPANVIEVGNRDRRIGRSNAFGPTGDLRIDDLRIRIEGSEAAQRRCRSLE